jgi:hypothetical protein
VGGARDSTKFGDDNEAPSQTPPPPPFGWSPSPAIAVEDKSFRSRDASSHPSFAKPLQESPSNTSQEGRRSAGRRIHWEAASQTSLLGARKPRRPCGARPFLLPPPLGGRIKEGARSPLGAPPRLLGPGPRFLEPPGANGRTLPGTSAASTSQSGHAPDRPMPRAARERSVWLRPWDRSRSTFRSTLAKGIVYLASN